MEDIQIIDLYWARDEGAIAASDEKYGWLCRNLSQNILDSREDAEECVNDTWHKAWDTMPPQRPGSLRAYLAKITRNLSIDRWRAKRAEKRGRGMDVLLEELEESLPAAPSAEELTEARETARTIERWLDTLSPADRTAFLRRYWYGQRVDRVAAQAGCSPNSMAKRLGRLRDGLRRALEQEGIKL
jgi:RNA polymerase sigma-70 factor (ECF subfamily)